MPRDPWAHAQSAHLVDPGLGSTNQPCTCSKYKILQASALYCWSFLRRIEGQMYDGVVKAKEEAQRQYTEAVSRGESAGVVR